MALGHSSNLIVRRFTVLTLTSIADISKYNRMYYIWWNQTYNQDLLEKYMPKTYILRFSFRRWVIDNRHSEQNLAKPPLVCGTKVCIDPNGRSSPPSKIRLNVSKRNKPTRIFSHRSRNNHWLSFGWCGCVLLLAAFLCSKTLDHLRHSKLCIMFMKCRWSILISHSLKLKFDDENCQRVYFYEHNTIEYISARMWGLYGIIDFCSFRRIR